MVGIKTRYERINKYTRSKLGDPITLVRPYTVISAFIVGFVGIMVERVYHGESIPDIFTVISVGAVLAAIQAASQIVNQVSDVEIDRINKSYRPLAKGTMTNADALTFAWLFTLFALWRAFTISIEFGVFVVLMLAFGLSYSIGPRIKERGAYISLFWMAFSRGMLPVLATWSIFSNLDDPFPWALGLYLVTYIFAFQGSKDFSDYPGDLQFNIPTLPVKYGKETAIKIMIFLGFVPNLLVIILIYYSFFPTVLISLLITIVIEFGIIYSLWQDRKISSMENNLAWVLFYAGLFLTYVIVLISLMVV